MIKRVNKETGEIMPMFKTQFNFDRDAESERLGVHMFEKTRTQQQFKEETDINTIMRKFGVTGELPQNVRMVLPDEYEDIGSYEDAMNAIRRADEAFMQMPSGVRSRFQNNPHLFTEFFSREENRLEAEKMGLVIPKPKAPVDQAPGEGQNGPNE